MYFFALTESKTYAEVRRQRNGKLVPGRTEDLHKPPDGES